jgi:16S rRNA (cytosine967-C5)-methyltransferase
MPLPSSLIRNQQKNFLRLLIRLRPHIRVDRALPARIQSLLSQNRAFGARDRRLYRELLYTSIRYWPWIEPRLDKKPEVAMRSVAWLAADTPVTHEFRTSLIDGMPPLPATIAARAECLRVDGAPLPLWFRLHGPTLFSSPQLEAMLSRAPLWLRLQTSDPQPIFEEFSEHEWKWRRTAVLPGAIELLADTDVAKTRSYQNGLIEIQDLGSQLILEAIGIDPGSRWLDACAGAGGKTLQLAALSGPRGHVAARDIRADALRELRARAARAGLTNIAVLSNHDGQTFDGVLVDAPCSGSGTWRRAPHLKWSTTPEHVEKAAQAQLALLNDLAPSVRPGGRLVYATCSLSRRENEDVITAFLTAHREFAPALFTRTFSAQPNGPCLTFLPALHDTDGFFVASLRRIG